ncbi:MAG: 3-dehydroquinate synthase [Actinomycetota bacterium]|nr:3-dehydroquinate synthase [Actinomycetota bacterium]
MTSPSVTVHVDTASRSYDVEIGAGTLSDLGSRVAAVSNAQRIALVSDETVYGLYGSTATASLVAAGYEVRSIVVPPGEKSKSWASAGNVLEQLVNAGLDRHDIVVALGGGVVGDLAGFCAATYMRGIEFVQVPTTLLAQVDSSVGGKTGVDLDSGKNLVGAFWQPLLVVADTEVLATLMAEDWVSGLAETAKMAVLEGEYRLAAIEGDAALLRSRSTSVINDAVAAAVRFKATIVARDERESGVRECLNLGHTLGHAIERVLGYGAVPHGVAVGEGMRFVARMAASLPGGSAEFAARQERLLDELGLPALSEVFDALDIHSALSSDKKSREGVVRWVLPVSPGVWRVEPINGDILNAAISRWASGEPTRG